MGSLRALPFRTAGWISPAVAHSRTGVLVCVVGIPSGYHHLRACAFRHTLSRCPVFLVCAGSWSGCRQGLAFPGEDQCEQLSRLGVAGVLRNLVRGAGPLVEHLSGFIYPLGLVRNLGDDGAFQYVRQNESCMMVRLTHASGRVRNMTDRHLPVIHG